MSRVCYSNVKGTRQNKSVRAREFDRPWRRQQKIEIAELLRCDTRHFAGNTSVSVAVVVAPHQRREEFSVERAVFVSQLVVSCRWLVIAKNFSLNPAD